MNTNRYTEREARELVGLGILFLGNFDRDDLVFLDRLDAANELVKEECESSVHASQHRADP